MPSTASLLSLIRDQGHGRITAEHVEPARSAQHAPWPTWSDPAVVAAYQEKGIFQPWRHQVLAANSLWEGNNTVITTGTGSGKSLAIWLAALTSVRSPPSPPTKSSPCVLYLAPTKALAADQVASLSKITSAMPGTSIATCDGDTPRDVRGWVQGFAQVVATNPDFLHFSLLPGHRRWRRLLRSLTYVFVDEGHSYRGLLGAHVTNVLRRLRRLCHHYGADPVWALASATTAYPDVSARRLLSTPAVTVVAEDTSARGSTHFLLWEPPVLTVPEQPIVGSVPAPTIPDLNDPWALSTPAEPGNGEDTVEDTPPVPMVPVETVRLSARSEVTRLLSQLTAAGARTLAFARSRRMVEVIASAARSQLADMGSAYAKGVAAYRGGYLPEERRALEAGIRSGQLRALASTNALELGIDIHGLDAVLLTGWPGSRASFWQQAGRAGRAGADGVVVLVGSDNPLDTYLVHHPEAIFAENFEATVFDPHNTWVLAPHLCAAAAELPLSKEDLPLFGSPGPLLEQLVVAKYLRKRPQGWFWVAAGTASSLTDLRGTGGRPVQVVEAETGALLGTVAAASADASVHPGAVYVHQGRTFLVLDYDQEEAVARVRAADVDFTTFAYSATTIDILATDATMRWGPVSWGLGDVEVSGQVTHYSRLRLPHLEVMDSTQLDMPTRKFGTRAVWFNIATAELRGAGIAAGLAPGALHAVEHAAIGMLPLLATCDRWDLGGVSTALHPQTGMATVFVHDAYPNGAGFADRAYQLADQWMKATQAAITSCDCLEGCPSCIQSPKCGNGNVPLDKEAAKALLGVICDQLPYS